MDFNKLNNQGFDIGQLNQLIKATEKGIDVSLITPNFQVETLRKINKLEYTDFSASRIFLIASAYDKNFDIIEMINPEFNDEQVKQIFTGQVQGIDYKLYANTEINAAKMKLFRKGLLSGHDKYSLMLSINSNINVYDCEEFIKQTQVTAFNCSQYIKDGFKLQKIKILFDSYNQGLNLESYAKPWMTTHQLEAALSCEIKNQNSPDNEKVNIKELITKDTPKTMIRSLYEMASQGYEVKELVEKGYDKSQFNVVKLGMEQKLDYKVYWDPKFSAEQMDKLFGGLSQGLDVSIIANEAYTPAQMQALVKLMKYNKENPELQIDISLVAHPEYDYSKMCLYISKLKRGTLEEKLSIIEEHNKLIKDSSLLHERKEKDR